MALASATLALVTLVCLIPVGMALRDPGILHGYPTLVVAVDSLCKLGALVGFSLGLIGWAIIGSSGGRVTGRGFATFGVLIPLVSVVATFSLDLKRQVLPPRMRCGLNLSGIGKAMQMYARDYDNRLPVAGGPSTVWGPGPADWSAASCADAFGLDPNGTGGEASVSSSLYLLVRYADIDPKYFICPGEWRMKVFDPGKYRIGGKKLTDVWDFGPDPALHCSYAYQSPNGQNPLDMSDPPSSAVAADRNPWVASPFSKPADFSLFKPDGRPHGGTPTAGRNGNSKAHRSDGQNVLFLDGHVDWIKRPYQDSTSYAFPVGGEKDNIYTSWDGDDKAQGIPPRPYNAQPADPRDSLLLNDPPRP